MKFLISTKIRYFWVIFPMLAVMSLALAYNDYSDSLLKFYPLIVFLGGCIIFTFVFLFRVVGMSFDEVRTIGLFSSRERVMVIEGRRLTVTALPKKKLSVELFGNDGVLAGLDWLKADDDGSFPDINLFRAKAVGGRKSFVGILKFYGLSREEALAVTDSGEEYEDELIRVYASSDEAQNPQINIVFLKTV